MPFIPKLPEGTTYREMTDVFAGRNHNAKISDGEFFETQNLTTAYYPLMSNRAKRGYVKSLYSPGGIMDKVELAYVDEGTLYINDRPTALRGLSRGEVQLVPFGAYICVFPDHKYYNTADSSDYGSMDVFFDESVLHAQLGYIYYSVWESPETVGADNRHYLEHPDQTDDTYYCYIGLLKNSSSSVTMDDLAAALEPLKNVGTIRLPVSKTRTDLARGTADYDFRWVTQNLCTILGIYVNDYAATVEIAHADPETGQGEDTGKYNPISGRHTITYDGKPGRTNYFLPTTCQNIYRIEVNGVQLTTSEYAFDPILQKITFNTAPGAGTDNVKVTYNTGEGPGPDAAILVSVPKKVTGTPNTNTVLQSDDVPDMDFVIECKDRLWGCKYGLVGGENINEIYACELGNFKNWKKYEGISMDPYTASVGSDGPWTGAINYLGYPTFFKEDRIHRVAVSAIGAHEITETVCDGVQPGSSRSLGVVNGVLFYKTNANVVVYQGGIAPSAISAQLGDVHYYDAAAGVIGDDYYISMRDAGNVWHLFKFDSKRALWMREDNLHVKEFATVSEELYALTAEKEIWALRGTAGTLEDHIDWYGESGILYYQYPDKKYVSRFNFRLQMDRGTRIRVLIDYDSSGRWEKQGEIITENLRTVTLPIRPRRCDHLRIRIEGRGNAMIFSLAKILEIGSDY